MRHYIAPTAVLLFACSLTACAGTDPTTADAAPAPPKETAMNDTPGSAGSAPASPSPHLQETCDAAPAQKFVGQPASTDVVEQARTAARARTARILKPGQMVTMEYRAGRLNIDVDEANTIKAVRCG